MMKSIPTTFILLIILFIGSIVRLYDLDGESIWVDEGHAIYVSSLDISEIIEENSRDNHPPLYSILLHLWMKLFSQSVFNLRLLSLIFGVFSIYLIYKVGEELLNKNAGLVAAFFLTLSVFHIYYSQEIRSYSLIVFFILISFLLFIRLLRQPKFHLALYFIIVSTLLIYTHFLGWFVLFAQNLIYISRFPIRFKRVYYVAGFNLLILLLYLPWIDVMLSRVYSMHEEFWVLLPSWLSIPQTFLIYSGTYTIYGVSLFLIFGFLIIYSHLEFKDRTFKLRQSYLKERYLLHFWMWVPIFIPFILSFLITPMYISRITIGASLAFYLFAVIGFIQIPGKRIKTGLIILIVLLGTGNVGIYYSETNKERWKDLTTYVENNAESGDLLIFHAGFGLDKAFNFYAKRDDLIKQPFPKVGLEVTEENVNQIHTLIKHFNTLWVILTHSRDEDNLIIKNIEQEFDLIEYKQYVSYGINSHRPYVGIKLYHFQR